MRITAILSLAALASAQAQYGQPAVTSSAPAAAAASGAPTTTIDTTSTATIYKTVFAAATHTTTVSSASRNATSAASSGFAKPTGNVSSTGSSIYPIATSAADAVKVGSAAQGVLFGAVMVAALLF